MSSAHAIRDRRDLAYQALADPTRRRLLRMLEDIAEPNDVRGLAAAIGLHPNTTRDHLELLRQAGLVVRAAEVRTSPGRPRMLYRLAPAETRSPESEGYRLLAEVLASYIEATVNRPDVAAEEAGRVWGHHLVSRLEPFDLPNPERAADEILSALDHLGFAPEGQRTEGRFVVRLSDCPFRDVARVRTDVVCSVHLGMLRGMAEELGGVLNVDTLDAFVDPSLCVATMSERD